MAQEERDLESALEAGATRGVSSDEMVRQFLQSVVFVPSGSDVGENFSGFVPVLFDRDGVSMLAVFSTRERAMVVEHLSTYLLAMRGEELARIMPPGAGIVVNPGHDVGVEFFPDVVQTMRAGAS